jgi:hypothetical protein
MATLERKASPQREIGPSFRAWKDDTEDKFSRLVREYEDWLSTLAEGEALFKKHVYDNPEAEQYDYRQHRAKLYFFLAEGEGLALEFLSASSSDEAKALNYVTLIDQKLDGLRAVLNAWHGALEDQKDIPESFKQGIRDFEAGRVVDMERALSEPPPVRS